MLPSFWTSNNVSLGPQTAGSETLVDLAPIERESFRNSAQKKESPSPICPKLRRDLAGRDTSQGKRCFSGRGIISFRLTAKSIFLKCRVDIHRASPKQEANPVFEKVSSVSSSNPCQGLCWLSSVRQISPNSKELPGKVLCWEMPQN